MSGAIKPNLVYPKEQWCLRLVTGAMANKAHWWWPSSFLGPVWGYHSGKLWPLVPKLAGIPNAKRVSSHLGDRILRPSFPSALARPSLHLTASHPPEITMQNHSLLQGLGCPPSHTLRLLCLTGHIYLGIPSESRSGVRHEAHAEVLMVVIFHPLLWSSEDRY